MTAILKTLPIRFARGEMERFLGVGEGNEPFCIYFFTLGRGQPKNSIQQMYFTHRNIILGYFDVDYVCQNHGQLPKLTTLDGEPSEWQIKPDRWVAVCKPPFHPLEQTVYHSGFRGWRYFDLGSYAATLDSKISL